MTITIAPLALQPEDVVRVCTEAIDHANDELRRLNLEVHIHGSVGYLT